MQQTTYALWVLLSGLMLWTEFILRIKAMLLTRLIMSRKWRFLTVKGSIFSQISYLLLVKMQTHQLWLWSLHSTLQSGKMISIGIKLSVWAPVQTEINTIFKNQTGQMWIALLCIFMSQTWSGVPVFHLEIDTML